ncbi:GntR family transcriptional regulator [Chenggangzhangella methanolivorans]|uniref:GntR family transcriptional regulator n=1 Tax=Chenggangzhangella methanolivorans TaxID=1437009 RepID=A0A9E6UNT2_9HYPH|nr:GntR family transcriptional regulator [Chenggangzhangella methanolivorans]QZN98924.1 GntR family transcriptional regulator [Chenggangzhangella methanolivorans]
MTGVTKPRAETTPEPIAFAPGARRADALRVELENAIVTGAFKPGDRLDEQSLADRFGVSRTPLREALGQLAATGLVTLQPRRGAFVASLGFRDIIERFETMAALEAMAGSLAARRIDSAGRRELETSLAACRSEAERSDSDSYYLANERFHHVIYAQAHNGFLGDEARRLHQRLKPYRRLQLRAGARVAVSLAEHERIAAAILAGDPAAAERELKTHILVQGDRLNDFLAAFERQGRDD